MVRSIVGKVMWVGRATVFFVGLAVILALVFGAATMALAKNGDPWILGKGNVATAITSLGGKQGADGPMVRITNNNAGANDTALALNVQAGEPPLRVNRATRVPNLNADKLDGQDARTLMPAQTYEAQRTVSMASTTTGLFTFVACDEGDVAISGGFKGLANPTQVKESHREDINPRHWRVSVIKPTGSEDTWALEAVCADFGEPHQQ